MEGDEFGPSVKPRLLRAKTGTASPSQLEQDLALPVLASDKMEWK